MFQENKKRNLILLLNSLTRVNLKNHFLLIEVLNWTFIEISLIVMKKDVVKYWV